VKPTTSILRSLPVTLVALLVINSLFLILLLLWYPDQVSLTNCTLLLPTIFGIVLSELIASLISDKSAWTRGIISLLCVLAWSFIGASTWKDARQREDLSSIFLNNDFEMMDYCRLTYSEKLKIESMSTIGIMDCTN
jgi:hypothetical protein